MVSASRPSLRSKVRSLMHGAIAGLARFKTRLSGSEAKKEDPPEARQMDVFSLTRDTYWGYDNGWGYQEEHWDAYSGPYFATGDHLVLLNNPKHAIVLHYRQDEAPKELWRGAIHTAADFQALVLQIETYRLAYCQEHGLDPERDIEHDLIWAQNGDPPSYKKLQRIPVLTPPETGAGDAPDDSDAEFDAAIDEFLDLLAAKERHQIERIVTDWNDLGQLLEAVKISRWNLHTKLMDALRRRGSPALRALIQRFGDPEFSSSHEPVRNYIMAFGEQAFACLREASHDANRNVRILSAQTAARFKGDEVTEFFLTLLDGHDSELMAEAATYLKDLGAPAHQERFIALLTSDPDSLLRKIAASALAKLGDARSLEVLIRAVTELETDRNTQWDIMNILKAWPDPLEAPRIKAAFVRLVQAPNEFIRAEAVTMLGEMQAQDLADMFLDLLGDEAPQVRAAAAEALGVLGHAPAGDRLLELLAASDEWQSLADRWVWLNAATALGRLQDERAIIPLLRVTHDQEKYEGCIALRALLTFGARAVQPVIDELRRAECPQLTANALEALGDLADVRGLGPVLDHVRDEEDYLRRGAFYAVKGICKANQCLPLKSVVQEFLRDGNFGERARAFVLESCGEDGMALLLLDMERKEEAAKAAVAEAQHHASDPTQLLLQLLQDPDWRVRKEAAAQLVALQDPRSADTLLKALDDPDWEVRAQVINALGVLGETRAVPRLAVLLESARASVRECGVEALGQIATDQAIRLLLGCYSLWGMAERVDAALLKLGDRAVPHLVEALDDPRFTSLLHNLIYILGELRATASAPRLQALLHDPAKSVLREYVEKALGKMGVAPEQKRKDASSAKASERTGPHVSVMSLDTFLKMNK